MANVNKVIILGTMGRDPEVQYMSNGKAVVNISVATNRRWKNASGEQQEEVEWHRAVAYERTAEVIGEYVSKGDQLYFEGRLKTRKWQDKEGRDQYTTEIVIDTLQLIGGKKSGGDGGQRGGEGEFDRPAGGQRQQRPAQGQQRQQSKPAGGFADMDDDIPFN